MKAEKTKLGHSRAPWTIGKCGCILSGRNTVCHSFTGSDELEANMRLISAAPELLEAAKAVLRWVPRNVERTDGKPSSRDRLIAAISKAEGVSHD